MNYSLDLLGRLGVREKAILLCFLFSRVEWTAHTDVGPYIVNAQFLAFSG